MISKEEHWKQLIEDWQNSQMTGMQWCREKGINCKTFYTWKNRLLKRVEKCEKSSFKEIHSNQPEKTGICLKIGNLSI